MPNRKRSVTPRPSKIPPAELMGPKFLLVEDDEVIIRAVIRQMKKHATVFTADTAETAWIHFQTHRHTLEIIYLDGMLRGGNSLNLLARIRASGYRGIIISITATPRLRESMIPPPNATNTGGEPVPRCDEYVPKQKIVAHMIAHLNNKPSAL